MYISKIEIHNYRNFKDVTVEFNDGINVILGHNNAGKSNLIKAMAIIFDSNMKKQLETDDFNKYVELQELKKKPPKINISITINQSFEENLMSDDLVTVSSWLTKLENPYEAKLTYEFFLPVKEQDNYINVVSELESVSEVWKIISDEFIRLYTYKIWGGNPLNQSVAEGENLQKFDFQFLNAIRDVERDMFTGKNTLLKSVIDFFMDYEIKSNDSIDDHAKKIKIKKKKKDFMLDAENLLSKLQGRMEKGKNQILSYAQSIGASFDKSSPNFDGNLSDIELYSALRLIVEYETGMKIPVSYNGLGYNNLIFMSLLLSKMQVNSNGKYLGSNAKVFPILCIEEPEAHLHPTMQYQFLKFLSTNQEKNKVRQIFVTTHSTHITASVHLDEMICLYKYNNYTLVGYPRKVFGTNEKSKKYVQRFLDATKSDMLFAEKVIFVEGIAEQLLMSVFAQYLDLSLEESHVTVINVGGRYFDYFLKIFDSEKKNTINRRIACITDRDPERKKKNSKYRAKKCYPFEYNLDQKVYDYQQNKTLDKYSDHKHPNIVSFSQSEKYGKTFEYELILENPSLELLVTDSMANAEEIRQLMKYYIEEKTFQEFEDLLRTSEENKRIIESFSKQIDGWSDDDKKKALIAARYLNSVGKGENALELAYVLQENLLKKGTDEFQEFKVPKYISDALEWVCNR